MVDVTMRPGRPRPEVPLRLLRAGCDGAAHTTSCVGRRQERSCNGAWGQRNGRGQKTPDGRPQGRTYYLLDERAFGRPSSHPRRAGMRSSTMARPATGRGDGEACLPCVIPAEGAERPQSRDPFRNIASVTEWVPDTLSGFAFQRSRMTPRLCAPLRHIRPVVAGGEPLDAASPPCAG